ncbi:hypothetical protein tb265_32760 [Gemmatimonadetes bacterium T265]|nr:hypothetical protein tb265_32760 [Gemmatimonadetes bacterium T265]
MLAAAAAGCRRAPAPSATPSPLPEYVFRCPDGGAELRARYVADSVVLQLPAGTATLPLAPSGSGARYANDTLEFWEHAGAVRVAQRGRARYEGCRRVTAADGGGRTP